MPLVTGSEQDLVLEATALAGRRAGKSVRAIAVDLYGREQVDADWHADSWMRVSVRRLLRRAGHEVMPRGAVRRQGAAFAAPRRIRRLALPARRPGSRSDGGRRPWLWPVRRRHRANPPSAGS